MEDRLLRARRAFAANLPAICAVRWNSTTSGNTTAPPHCRQHPVRPPVCGRYRPTPASARLISGCGRERPASLGSRSRTGLQRRRGRATAGATRGRKPVPRPDQAAAILVVNEAVAVFDSARGLESATIFYGSQGPRAWSDRQPGRGPNRSSKLVMQAGRVVASTPAERLAAAGSMPTSWRQRSAASQEDTMNLNEEVEVPRACHLPRSELAVKADCCWRAHDFGQAGHSNGAISATLCGVLGVRPMLITPTAESVPAEEERFRRAAICAMPAQRHD